MRELLHMHGGKRSGGSGGGNSTDPPMSPREGAMYLLAARIAALPEVWEQVMAMYVTCKRGYTNINLINEKKYYLK